MQPLDIVKYPDPVLRKVAKPVEEIDDAVRERARQMVELMRRDKGVGLAAPQVGWSARLFVVCPSGKPEEARVLVNPVIRALGKAKEKSNEGCLSLPEVFGKIERPVKIELRAYTLEGVKVEEEIEGFPARVCQHEFDHLEGVLIIDRMGAAERSLAEGQLKNLEWSYKEKLAAAKAPKPAETPPPGAAPRKG